MLNFRGSASVAVPPVIQRWCPGRLHRGLTQEHVLQWFSMKLLGEGFCTVMNNRGLSKSLGELLLSHLSLPSGCNQHALYFKTSLPIYQHWLGSWLGTIRQQAIISTNIVQFLWHNFVSPGHNGLMSIWCRMQQFQNRYIWCVTHGQIYSKPQHGRCWPSWIWGPKCSLFIRNKYWDEFITLKLAKFKETHTFLTK